MLNASFDDGHQRSRYQRIELITGEVRRRRWTAEEKARILAESFQPGARASEVALRLACPGSDPRFRSRRTKAPSASARTGTSWPALGMSPRERIGRRSWNAGRE